MDSSSCSYAPDFSDIYDSDGDSKFWYNFGSEKTANTLQEDAPRIRDSLESSVPPHQPEKCSLKQENLGNVPNINIFASTESEKMQSEIVNSKCLSTNSAAKVLDQDNVWDFVRYSDERLHTQKGGHENASKTEFFNKTENEVSYFKIGDTSSESSFCEEKTLEKCEDEFWDFLKSADDSQNTKQYGFKMFSKMKTTLNKIKNEVSCHITIDTVGKLKEKTSEKDEDEFWDFLKNVDDPQTSKQSDLKNASKIEATLDKIESGVSKTVKISAAWPCSVEGTPEKNGDEFWDFLNSIDELGNVETSSFKKPLKEPLERLANWPTIENDVLHLKTVKSVDASCPHENVKGNDEFWNFLETDCKLDSDKIQSLKRKLDCSKSSHIPIISNNLASNVLKPNVNMAPNQNENFGNISQPEYHANICSNISKLCHSMELSGTEVPSEQISPNMIVSSANSVTVVKPNELNIRRKRNINHKIMTKMKKERVFDRNINNASNKNNENTISSFKSQVTNEELKLSLNNATKLPLNMPSVSDEESSYLKGSGKIPQTSQPIITSFFSIASCPNIFDQLELASSFSDNSELNLCCGNSLKQGTTELKAADLMTTPESTSICPSEICAKHDFSRSSPSITKKKNIKRPCPENSPENSIFKITDYGGDINADEESLKVDFVEGKRFKMSDPHDEKITSSQEVPGLQSTCTIFFSSAPQLAPSPNQTPYMQLPIGATRYVVVPRNMQTSLNHNSETLILINTNPIETNTSLIKVPLNGANFTVPVSPYPNEISSNLSSNREKTTEVPYGGFNVDLTTSVQVTNAPSFNIPTLVYQPSLQSLGREQIPSNIPFPGNKIDVLSRAMCLSQSETQFKNSAVASVDTTKQCALNSTVPDVPIVQNLPCSNLNPCLRTFSMFNDESIRTINVGGIFPKAHAIAPFQCSERVKSTKIKPIKTISIGKDKNAIQQTSYPVTVESSADSRVILDNKEISLYPNIVLPPISSLSQQEAKIMVNNQKQELKKNSKSTNTLNFTQYKPNTNTFLVEKNLILNTSKIVTKNVIYKTKQNINNQNLKHFPVYASGGKTPVNLNFETKQSSSKIITPNTKYIIPVSVQSTAPEIRCSESGINTSQKSQNLTTPVVTLSSKNALDALKKLFPPPISMVPVCVIQSVPTTNKSTVSKVLVLQSPILPSSESKPGGRKTVTRRTVKKETRKTVRELLQEKYGNPPGNKLHDPTAGLQRLNYAVSNLSNDSSATGQGSAEFVTKSSFTVSKRPNIMVLPSAANFNLRTNSLPEKMDQHAVDVHETDSTSFLKPYSTDFLSDSTSFVCSSAEKEIAAKDCRPRHYDMCELSIGSFKVEDFVDTSGCFQSKFKVLFTKRQFIYDFPVSKSNQVDDLCDSEEWDVFAKIVVPFDSIEGMSSFNRRMNLKLKSVPLIFLWKLHKSKYDPTPDAKRGYVPPLESSLWMDVVKNSFVHKITLRKRQADNLKDHLCLVEPCMPSLFDAGLSLGLSLVDVTPYDEEILSTRLRKLPKNKKNNVRRLPQWDTSLSESPLGSGDKLLLSSNHICSCRISCRSLRCSCVKAAKSCSSSGAKCMCTGCDNPLNILESLGLDVELSLKDRCLFQNIYQIPKLRSFLERSVNLSCCNTVARVMDCIPSTILCPNMECNACLEFSWCRGIVCYPERNPRKHCSYCGQCCFSNGRHCLVCNRCYTVTLKRPDCPNCKSNGILMNPTSHDTTLEDSFYSDLLAPTNEKPSRSLSKPEIVLLDSSVDTKSEDESCSDEKLISINYTTEKQSLSGTEHFLEMKNSPQSSIIFPDVKIISSLEGKSFDPGEEFPENSNSSCDSVVEKGNENSCVDLDLKAENSETTKSLTCLFRDDWQDTKPEDVCTLPNNVEFLYETGPSNNIPTVKDVEEKEDNILNANYRL